MITARSLRVHQKSFSSTVSTVYETLDAALNREKRVEDFGGG